MNKTQAHIKNFFRASAEDFKKIPGSPIVYWVSPEIQNSFFKSKLNKFGHACSGIQTGDNELYLRYWYEVKNNDIGFDLESLLEAQNSKYRWFPHKKGGEFRRWYGNCEYIIDWSNNGLEIKNNPSSRPQNIEYWFKEAVTWSHTSSSLFSARISPIGYTFNVEGPSYFSENPLYSLGYLCSKPALYFMLMMNPTLHFLVGSVSMLPYIKYELGKFRKIEIIVKQIIRIVKSDWDSYETSWDFTALPLLAQEHKPETIIKSYNNLRALWQETTLEMQRLEEENNHIFIEAYGLEDEITPDVPLKEITLTCNPYYRYGVDADGLVEKGVFPINQAIEDRLQADTMKEFISYAVGCMFGRYSLDKEGLILANAGDCIEQYMTMVPEPSFKPDESGILPLTDADDFNDDLPTQFYRFLRTTFGEEHYHENLRFIEDSIGKTVRQYFLKYFFKDHVQRYKKRPIYWLVTSPKGSFRAFIYLHRYTKDTVGQVLNDYVRPFEKKLESKIAGCRQIDSSVAAGTKEKIQAQRDVDRFEKALQEISEWDANVLRPLALKRVELDLDDGVKVNYAKLGDVLEKVKGLNG